MNYVKEWMYDLKKTLTNRHFWKIQWLNLMYIVKYTAKYRLIIIVYSLSMSYLYVQLTTNSDGLLTKIQSEAIVSACVVLFIFVRQLWLFISLGKLIMPNSGEVDRVKRWNIIYKQALFVILVMSSKYLNTDMIIQTTSVEAIPSDMIASGVSAVFCLVTLTFLIRQFWKRLDKQMILSDITSNERLTEDICGEKVHFCNDWNEFIRVIETGITYRYNQNNDLFYVSSSKYAKNSETALEKNVIVALKYSLITEQLSRLESPMVISEMA